MTLLESPLLDLAAPELLVDTYPTYAFTTYVQVLHVAA
jgi:hypothetical protein